MSKASPAKNSPVHIPATDDDDTDIGDFPDGEQEVEEEDDGETGGVEPEKAVKRVSVIRRGITALLKIDVDTPDSEVIDCVRQLVRQNNRIAEIEKESLATDAKLKEIKKKLLIMAVGDQLGV